MSEPEEKKQTQAAAVGPVREYVTVYIGEQMFGIPVTDIHEVFHPQSITRVPLAPPEVRGVLNLRGRIVTAIEVRTRLGLPPLESDGTNLMAIGVEVNEEAYGLIIDRVGDVLQLPERDCEAIPCNMDRTWQAVASGIYRLDSQLMIVLDIKRLLAVEEGQAQAA